jgi:hypothetical protein
MKFKDFYCENADILFYHSTNWLGKSIAWATTGYRESKTFATHTGLLTAGQKIIEALFPQGVTFRDFKNFYDGSNIVIARPLNLSDRERLNIVMAGYQMIDEPYGTLKLIPQLGDGILGKILKKKDIIFFRKVCGDNKFPICSTLVARCYEHANLNFGIDDRYANPDEIFDF